MELDITVKSSICGGPYFKHKRLQLVYDNVLQNVLIEHGSESHHWFKI